MDVNAVVNYEKLFSLTVLHPITDEPFGLTMQIRSSGSEACKAIYRKHADDILDMRYRGKRPKGKQAEKEELERTAACIASWDWGKAPDKTTKDDEGNVVTIPGDQATFNGEKPPLTIVKAIEVLDKVPWIYAQVKEAADRLENFSETSSPKS